MRTNSALYSLVVLGVFASTIASAPAQTTGTARKSQVQPAQNSSTYDPTSVAIRESERALSKTYSLKIEWNHASVTNDSGSILSSGEQSGPRSLVDKSVRYMVFVNQLTNVVTLPTPAYSKRSFAVIPTNQGVAKIEIYDVTNDRIVGNFESQTNPETCACPTETTHVMKTALTNAISKFFSSTRA